MADHVFMNMHACHAEVLLHILATVMYAHNVYVHSKHDTTHIAFAFMNRDRLYTM